MGIDLYAGPFTRLVMRDWKTAVERDAEARGIRVTTKWSTPLQPGLDPERVRSDFVSWQGELRAALAKDLGSSLEWSEAPETAYFTEQLGWWGYGGLMFRAACDAAKLRPEDRLPDDWERNDVWNEALRSDRYLHLFSATAWLPGDFRRPIRASRPLAQTFGSVVRLRNELAEFNKRVSKGTDAQMREWAKGHDEDLADWKLSEMARFGLAVFVDLVDRAIAEKLPLAVSF